MRATLMMVLFALCCGCEAVRRVHVALPGGSPSSLGSRVEFEAYAATNQDIRDALQIIGEVAQAHGLIPSSPRGDFSNGQGTVAAYARGFFRPSWMGNSSWTFHCIVDYDPAHRRLTAILMNSRSDETFDAVYAELQQRLRDRFGADRIRTFWM